MNGIILAKRQEAENKITQTHKTIKEKLVIERKLLDEEREIVKMKEEKLNLLNHQSFLLSAELTEINSSKKSFEEKILDLECKIDEFKVRGERFKLVREKEEKTQQLHYNKIAECQESYKHFWQDENKEDSLEKLQDTIEKLSAEKENLQQSIANFKSKKIEDEVEFDVRIVKLSEECLIVKKRNSAIQKRLTRRLEGLERQLQQHYVF